MMLVGLPLRVPPGRSQRMTRIGMPTKSLSASSHGPTTTMPDAGPPVDGRLDRLAELDLAVDDGPVREAQPQRGRVRIRPRCDLHELEDDQLIDQAVGVVRQEEPAVLDDADAR